MTPRVVLLVCLTMIAFAANSLLARYALSNTTLDAATFTLIRLASGALLLALLIVRDQPRIFAEGSVPGALALFVYAAGFSFAYRELDTGVGALLLFGAVQMTMLGVGFYRGERFSIWQSIGFFAAVSGLVYLLAPGASAPAPLAAVLMLLAGVAWGVYSLLGRGARKPLAMTAGNFLFSVPLGLMLVLLFSANLQWDTRGVVAALASGMLASGCGYALWYHTLPQLTATVAASVQLTVPIIAAMLGWLILDESWSSRLSAASVLVLGGIFVVIRAGNRAAR